MFYQSGKKIAAKR